MKGILSRKLHYPRRSSKAIVVHPSKLILLHGNGSGGNLVFAADDYCLCCTRLLRVELMTPVPGNWSQC